MSIYGKLLEHAEKGGAYHIDLHSKNLRIGNKYYIREGVMLIEDDLICSEDFNKFNIFDGDITKYAWKNVVWHLYNIFKHSWKSKSYRNKSYFKAIEDKDLTLRDMVYGADRHFAQAVLEGYVLLGSLAGWITWDEDKNHWFWQDKEHDLDLLILKDWIN